MSSSSSSANDSAGGTTPLLNPPDGDDRGLRSLRRNSLALFLRRAGSRRLMREPSMLVRESAADELEERQNDWAYSKPVVILDILWNLAFVFVAAAVLVLSWKESPVMPLRLWILGYVLQCVLHVVCVWVEYRRRCPRWWSMDGGIMSAVSLESEGDSSRYVTLARLTQESTSTVAKHLESANTMFSFIWWIIGFYWISSSGQILAQDSPRLYWLCILFLAFDVFFVVFCVALASIIGIAVCCCLPCIIAILYAVADQQEGATKEDVEQLPKYKFKRINDGDKLDFETQGPCAGVMVECGTSSPIEHVLSIEDAECCICLSTYDDGAELRELPCGHHFHCTCVDKWLYINATCPLCKYNILKNSNQPSEV